MHVTKRLSMHQDTPATTATVADAPQGNWVDRWAPEWSRPYLRLARFDRPIGAWLLLFPCWWSLALAEHANGRAWPSLWYGLLFGIGALVMRGAGCTYNDIVDRDFDARVARTRSRPIPSGQVSVKAAAAFMVGLCLVGLAVLLQFNAYSIAVGMASLVPVAIYPFMKRFTYWPQIVLGLTFKWGALIGWTAARGRLEVPALLMYVGCVSWTVGYDTIYAHQDKEDDLSVGLKSTALRLGDATKPWLVGLYSAALALWAAAFWLAGAGALAFAGLAVAAAHMVWQVATLDIDDPGSCLARFRSNRDLGFIVLAGIVADMAWIAAHTP